LTISGKHNKRRKKMTIIEKLKNAGYKFSKKNWPTIHREEIKALGITPGDLEREFRPATLSQTMGPHYCIGFFLQCGKNARRPVAVRK